MSNHTSSAGIVQTGNVEQLSPTRKRLSASAVDFDAVVELARESGMLVTLDGQIGREKYQSIVGSLTAFRRFIDALHGSLAGELTT
jgi:hypothetical protein